LHQRPHPDTGRFPVGQGRRHGQQQAAGEQQRRQSAPPVSVDFTADLPVLQIRRAVMRRALIATDVPPRVALAMV
jgi:hypothetical protein